MSDGSRTIVLYGDEHRQDGTDLNEAPALMEEFDNLMDNDGHAFIELGAFQMQRVLENEGMNGLYYRLPYLLHERYDYTHPRLFIRDIRATATSTPFISWFNCSVGELTTTVVTWQCIQDRFNDAEIRIGNISDHTLREAAQQIYSTTIPTWTAVQEYVNLDDCILPAVGIDADVSIGDVNRYYILMRLYEVGLLCDMENWLISLPNTNCIVFCGYHHIPPLVKILQKFNLSITEESVDMSHLP